MPPPSSSAHPIIIDCGVSRTALGVFSQKQGRLACLTYAVEKFRPSAAGDDQWLANTTAALVALNPGGRSKGPVVLVLPAHLTLTKQIQTPRVDAAKREKIVRFEAGQYIPFALAQVVWGCVESGHTNAVQQLMLVAAKLDIVTQLCAAASAAGFRPHRVVPASLTTILGYQLSRRPNQTSTLVLNLGARSSVLGLVDRGCFAVRTIPLGGSNLTQRIAENQNCDLVAAERIKSATDNAEILAAGVASIAERLSFEVTRSVLHFRREGKFDPPVQLVLAGGGGRACGMQAALAEKLKLPVTRCDEKALLEGGVEAPGEDVVLIDLAGAAVLALRPEFPGLNLLPDQFRQQDNLHRRQPWLLSAVTLVGVALLPPLIHYRQVIDDARTMITAVEESVESLREREKRRVAGEQVRWDLEKETAEMQEVLQRQTSWLRLLAALQERLVETEHVWLESMHVSPSFEGSPMKLKISGRMLDTANPRAKVSPGTFNRVTTLLSGIAGLPFVSTVTGERFDNSQPGILKFDFVMQIDPAEPL